MNCDAIRTGKRGEYRVIGKLLEKGFTVYTPVIDIDGIDCIIRNDKKRLIEIQIKTRNKNNEEETFFKIKEFKPNWDFFICCYLIDVKELWVIPSYKFHKLSSPDIEEKDKRILRMNSSNQIALSKYKGNKGIELLKSGKLYERGFLQSGHKNAEKSKVLSN